MINLKVNGKAYEVDEDTGRIKYGPKGKHYFKFHPVTGQPVSFETDFYVPFVREFQKMQFHEHKLIR